MPDALAGLDRLRHFIATATRLATPAGLAQSPELQAAFAALIAHDDWLPEACTAPHPQYYQQYLLHCDPLERFSLVSFVWGRASRRRCMITRSGAMSACCVAPR